MLTKKMEAIVNQIYDSINSPIDEIGIVFQEQSEVVIVENQKLGIPNRLIPKLKLYVNTTAVEEIEVDKKYFIKLICSG